MPFNKKSFSNASKETCVLLQDKVSVRKKLLKLLVKTIILCIIFCKDTKMMGILIILIDAVDVGNLQLDAIAN